MMTLLLVSHLAILSDEPNDLVQIRFRDPWTASNPNDNALILILVNKLILELLNLNFYFWCNRNINRKHLLFVTVSSSIIESLDISHDKTVVKSLVTSKQNLIPVTISVSGPID